MTSGAKETGKNGRGKLVAVEHYEKKGSGARAETPWKRISVSGLADGQKKNL